MNNVNNLIEYTFKFKKNDSYSLLESVFVASNDTEAFDIANNYMEKNLENRYDSAEMIHRKELSVWE
jgi:hypothetical protein